MQCFLLRLLILMMLIPAPGYPLIEEKMRESLRKIMKCEKENRQPAIAMSPARYLQAVALIRHDAKESSCGNPVAADFHLEDPRTWSFCVAGKCVNEKCLCFASFTGDHCQMFKGKCWLLFCRPENCGNQGMKLVCFCRFDFYQQPVTSGDYWYDEGLKHSYQPPPSDWKDSHSMISKILSKQNEMFFAHGSSKKTDLGGLGASLVTNPEHRFGQQGSVDSGAFPNKQIPIGDDNLKQEADEMDFDEDSSESESDKAMSLPNDEEFVEGEDEDEEEEAIEGEDEESGSGAMNPGPILIMSLISVTIFVGVFGC